jgi:hypothetical protein
MRIRIRNADKCSEGYVQVYLSSQQEVFAYLSGVSSLLLLGSLDPFLVSLQRRHHFRSQLLATIGRHTHGAYIQYIK